MDHVDLLPSQSLPHRFDPAGSKPYACVNRIAALRKLGVARPLPAPKRLGLAGFGLTVVHMLMSLVLLVPKRYDKFFTAEGDLSSIGELSLLFGVLGVAVLAIPAITSLPGMLESLGAARWRRAQRLGLVGLALSLAHVVVMGIKGWLDVGRWPGGMPPMTMIAVALTLPGLVLPLIAAVRKKPQRSVTPHSMSTSPAETERSQEALSVKSGDDNA